MRKYASTFGIFYRIQILLEVSTRSNIRNNSNCYLMNTVIPHKIILYYLHDAIILYFTLHLGARGASYDCVTVHNIIMRMPKRE